MGRPKGYRLSAPAFSDLCAAKHITMTEAAAASGLGLTTVSNLVHDVAGASMRTVRALSDGLKCQPATLFPELLGTASEPVIVPTEVAS